MKTNNSYLHIDCRDQLVQFCQRHRTANYIGFDTEFVSENRYRPELCLLQVAADDEIAIIDTLEIKDLSPFWELLTTGQHVTIAHAAREEFLFCHRACGERPKRLFDIQLAAGFVGFDYPASYSNLVSQMTGVFVPKGETRTDWKKRPLSDQQIRYALGDVEHLRLLCHKLTELLEKFGRYDWYVEEVEHWLDELIVNEDQPQWKKISGAAKLNRRALGILSELWQMRDQHARQQNRSAKRIIPDDLMIELSKRGSAKVSNIRSIRGFDSRVSKRLTDNIVDAIQLGLEIPDSELPKKLERGKNINLGLVGQFLSTVLGVVCRNKQIAPSLVGTTQDLRSFAAWRLGQLPKKPLPSLANGWRSEIIGNSIENAIEGKLALRVADPKAEHPLAIEELS